MRQLTANGAEILIRVSAYEAREDPRSAPGLELPIREEQGRRARYDADAPAPRYESAARVFMQLAKDMGIQGLQAFFFKGGDKGYGYFGPAGAHKALGCAPEISIPAVKG